MTTNHHKAVLRIDRIRVEELVSRLRDGRLLIPEFQRDYVWKPAQAAKLIDSLYKNYPVGSLLVWETSEEVGRRDRATPTNGARGALWLIDGQQRSRTLSRILAVDHDTDLDIYFNVIDETFARANAAIRNDNRWVRLSDILGDAWRTTRDGLLDDFPRQGDVIEEHIGRCREILKYEIPLIVMQDHGFADAVDAFQRINMNGVRLRKDDLESTRVAAAHSGFIREEVLPLIEDLQRRGFDRLYVSHLFKATEVIAQPGGRRTRLHELDTREIRKAWAQMRRGLDRTLQLLRAEFSVANMSILWSGALLVPPIVLASVHDPRARDAKLIAAWMALAALLHRYSGASETALDQDLKACAKSDPLQGLLRNLRSESGRRSLRAEEDDFDATIQDRGAMFAAYVACRHSGAVDIFTGQKIGFESPEDQLHRHHIFPRAGFANGNRRNADQVANIAFILPDTNIAIGKEPPEQYFKSIKAKRLATQCVPEDRALLADFDAFCGDRRQRLADAFNQFLADSGVP